MRYDYSYKIDSYKIKLCSRDSGWVSSYQYTAIISLYQGRDVVGLLYFKPDVGTQDDNYFKPSSGKDILRLYFNDADFDRVVDLLRNETPVYANLRKTHVGKEGIGALTTTEEPIGEEES